MATDLKTKDMQIKEHMMQIADVEAKYETNVKTGLGKEQAEQRLTMYGKNQLTPPKQTPEVVKFLKQLAGGFSLLLWFGAILCLFVYTISCFDEEDPEKDNLYLGVTLIVVVILTGAFAYYQESKSSAIMDSFKDLIPRKAFVLRDGVLQETDPVYLVLGDIVEVNSGDQVPADILILESSSCKVDNSSITGESEPLQRSNQCTHENPLETENIAFFSTYVTEGRARGMVIRTGDSTLIGQIAFLTTGLGSSETSIALEIKHFIKLVTLFSSTLGTIFFILSLCIGYNWLEAVIFFIGIIVANVPEGLLATVTVSLTLTAKSMAKKNCLVKNLQAVETLGSTSIICSDKTGTLTQNRMSVAHVWFGNDTIAIKGLKEAPKNPKVKAFFANKASGFEDFLRVVTLCNKAKFKPNQKRLPLEKRECTGDASETALFKFVASLSVSVNRIRRKYPVVAEIPFNSFNKYYLTVHELANPASKHYQHHKYLVCIKGAPERILNLCNSILLNGESRDFDAVARRTMGAIFEHLAGKGERVLGFAEMYINNLDSIFEDAGHTKVNLKTANKFTLLGLMSLIDPARPEVPDAVAKCRQAGIRVFMVTGDHPLTARAIAEGVGIITKAKEDIVQLDDALLKRIFRLGEGVEGEGEGKAMVVPGDMLSKLSSDHLDYVVRNYMEIVFARTSPQQKLMIVQSCQRLGHMVAVTGDGVNDSPALKSANIGIAMGITGSDVSKQAADLILLDDNFASIIVGIEEGRVIFDNLKKSIAYTLASNYAEIMPFLVYVALGFPLALGTTTILCIDLGTDIFPAISLAYEKAESDIMKQKPRSREDHLVTRRMFNRAYFQIGMIQASAGFMNYFMVLAASGFFITDLFNLRSVWDNKQYLIVNRYDEAFDYGKRKKIEGTAQTAYFVSIVVCQWADLIICKTRRNNICKQGMTNNVLNISLVVETILALFLSYCPGMYILKLFPLYWFNWFVALPFAVYIILYDEVRRLMLRHRPGGFFEDVTYF
ncbi:Sodium/potassium-transporting ATPase subunit alpha-1 [Tyrophagus putrescentiae]|nr:Sodium/potassium-transporting ATPase subunit alpha-1 [Tyrophagus putrescentiae]